MSRMTAKIISSTGEEKIVEISPFAQYQWEKDTGRKLSELQNSVGMGDVARMVWHQLRAQAYITAVAFEEWLKDVYDLEMVDGNPQQPGGGQPVG